MPTKDEIIEQQNTLILKRNEEINDLRIKLSSEMVNNMGLLNKIEAQNIIIEEQQRQISLLNALNK